MVRGANTLKSSAKVAREKYDKQIQEIKHDLEAIPLAYTHIFSNRQHDEIIEQHEKNAQRGFKTFLQVSVDDSGFLTFGVPKSELDLIGDSHVRVIEESHKQMVKNIKQGWGEFKEIILDEDKVKLLDTTVRYSFNERGQLIPVDIQVETANAGNNP